MKYSHNSNEMMDFIAQQIDNSKLSDIEIANIIGISEVGVFKIRKRHTNSIRRNTLASLCEALNLNYSINKGEISFTKKGKPFTLTGINKMSSEITEKIIESQLDTIKNHIKNEEKKDNIINELNDVIKSLNTQITELEKEDVYTLDINRYEALIKMNPNNIETATFLDITPKYAELLGYRRFDLLGEDTAIISSLESLSEQQVLKIRENMNQAFINGKSYHGKWKLLHKNGSSIYIEADIRQLSGLKLISTIKVIDKKTYDDTFESGEKGLG